MTYLEHVENGAIVLGESAALPDGTTVRIESAELEEQFAEGERLTAVILGRLGGLVNGR